MLVKALVNFMIQGIDFCLDPRWSYLHHKWIDEKKRRMNDIRKGISAKEAISLPTGMSNLVGILLRWSILIGLSLTKLVVLYIFY